MIVLGVSGLYHDSAAAIVKDGEIIAAAQEERFSRVKHDSRLPVNAISYCIKEAGITQDDIDYVVYYDNPLITLDRFLKNVLALGENSDRLVQNSFDSIMGTKLWIHQKLRECIGKLGKEDELLVCRHHISHAASAFYPSPFEEAAFITLDGVGEWETTTIGYGKGNDLVILKEINYPHSIGLLYSAFTYFCGFKVNSGDYKLMGLAPYGEPVYYDLIKKELIDIKEDGSYRLNLKYFDFYRNDVMTNHEFEQLFGGPKREPEADITKREMDMAASVQQVVEEVLIKMAKFTRRLTGMSRLVLGGGVALNCVANGKLLMEHVFDDIWIQPAAGDAGGALGAALYVYYQMSKQIRVTKDKDTQKGSYLGPAYAEEKVRKYLDDNNYQYHICATDEERNVLVAKMLQDEMVIGLCNGRMEFGPRALGNRSIIGDARSINMQTQMNLKIKYRESFRPFAPSVLEEDAEQYFVLDGSKSPYMLLVGDVVGDRRKPFNMQEFYPKDGNNKRKLDLLPIVNMARSDIPAVTHVDYSARVQTVSQDTNPDFYGIIQEFKKLTGSSVIVNTSFNVRGEPIVCSPKDAYECFMRTQMDALVLGRIILYKEEQTNYIEKENWREKYVLD